MRRTILWILVIALSILTGIAIGTSFDAGLVILGVLVIIALIIFSLSSPNRALFLLFISFLSVDMIRRLIEFVTGYWGPVTLIFIDIFLVLTLASIVLPTLINKGFDNTRFPPLRFPNSIKIPFFVFGGWVLISLLNPRIVNYSMTLVGIRQYLSPIAGLFLGWYISHNWKTKDWERAGKFVLWASGIVVLFSIVQLAVDQSQLGGILEVILSPGGGDHAIHSWGTGVVELTTSFFSASKRYGRYLVITYPFVWAYTRNSRRAWLHWFAISFYMVGAIVSGSREASVLLLIELLLLGGSSTGLFRQGIVIFFAIILFMPFISNSEVQTRLEFSVGTKADWETRLSRMITGPFEQLGNTDISTFDYLVGLGAGKYGSSQLLDESISPELRPFILNSGGQVFDAVDSGLYKILVEMGVVGIVLFMYFNWAILWIAAPWKSIIKENIYCRAASAGVIMWLVLFYKGHTTINDLMLDIFLGAYLAIIFVTYQREELVVPI